MMGCEEVARSISSGERAGASLRTRLALRVHLLMCRHCRWYVTQLDLIDEAARQRWGEGREDAAALERLERAIGFEPGSTPVASGGESED